MLSKVAPTTPNRPQRIYVYRGEGAGWRSVRSTCDSLQRLLTKPYEVSTLSAVELLNGSWVSEAALLVMPGGADLPFCKHLNGKGNRIIKDYVSAGGAYLGLCAGAYYACSYVDFERGTALQVVGDRELCFFPGIAQGAAFAGFDYLTEAGAVAADVHFQVPAALAEPAKQWQQELQQDSAEISCGVQQSRTSRTSMLEPRSTGCNTWLHTKDYCNGGPVFLSSTGDMDLSDIPGVKVLAVYSSLVSDIWQEKSKSAGLCQGHQLQEPLQQQQPAWQQLPRAQQQAPLQDQSRHQQQRTGGATQSAPSKPARAVAAVRCQVGSGVAVLCGTHPELDSHWLDVCGRSQENTRAAGADTARQQQATTSSRTGVLGRQEWNTVTALQQAAASQANLAAVSAGAISAFAVAAESAVAEQRNASIPHQPGPVVADVLSAAVEPCSTSAAAVKAAGCDDVELAMHTARLKSTLAAHQQHRDLFLSSLLYEALSASRG